MNELVAELLERIIKYVSTFPLKLSLICCAVQSMWMLVTLLHVNTTILVQFSKKLHENASQNMVSSMCSHLILCIASLLRLLH